jgi:hypothetical protein
MIAPIAESNDWTLDTNVLIVANGPLRAGRQPAPLQDRQPAIGQVSRKQIARNLLICVASKGMVMWSNAVASEYQARGAITLSRTNPPVPVSGNARRTYCGEWLARPGLRFKMPNPLNKLSGAEKEDLHRAQFHDQADHRFLELARSSDSKRLVTEEQHYNRGTIRAIKRILNVKCLDYDTALDKCQA